MRDHVDYSDSRNPRFMKTSHQSILLCFRLVTCGSQIKIYKNRLNLNLTEFFQHVCAFYLVINAPISLTVSFEF